MEAKSLRAKECNFTKAVKAAVFERDGGRCVLCGSNQGVPNAHFIPRSQGGLGVEENGLTLCLDCHNRYDNGSGREETEARLEEYLKSKYSDWDKQKLYYKKGDTE